MTIQYARRIGLYVCAAALLLHSGAALAADAVAAAEKVRGEAHLTRAGADQAVIVGTAFMTRDRVATGAGARLKIAFKDGSFLTMSENTAIEITRYAVNPAGGSRNVLLTTLSGLVNVVAAKTREANFNYQVRAGNAYSAVRGTNWIVAAGISAASFYVVEGLVEVGTGGGARAVVGQGKSISVDAKGGMSAVQPIPPELMKQVLDATDVASASAAPEAAPAATTTPAPAEAPATSPAETPAAPAKTTPERQKSGGGGGGGGGGSGHGGHM
jgi:ferric-dicitrate binding protein FerR (iron transport regulator)